MMRKGAGGRGMRADRCSEGAGDASVSESTQESRAAWGGLISVPCQAAGRPESGETLAPLGHQLKRDGIGQVVAGCRPRVRIRRGLEFLQETAEGPQDGKRIVLILPGGPRLRGNRPRHIPPVCGRTQVRSEALAGPGTHRW